jgi:hypothetical protein
MLNSKFHLSLWNWDAIRAAAAAEVTVEAEEAVVEAVVEDIPHNMAAVQIMVGNYLLQLRHRRCCHPSTAKAAKMVYAQQQSLNLCKTSSLHAVLSHLYQYALPRVRSSHL